MTKMKGKSGRSLHAPPGLPFDSEAGHPAFSKPVIPSGHQLHRAVYPRERTVDHQIATLRAAPGLPGIALVVGFPPLVHLPDEPEGLFSRQMLQLHLAPHPELQGRGHKDPQQAHVLVPQHKVGAATYVEANRHILNCAYDAMGRDALRRFFYTDFIEITLSLVEQAELHTGCQTDPEFKRFLAEFYTEALAGMLINLFKAKDFPYSKAEIRENIILLLKTALPAALRAGAAKGAEHPF